MSAVIVRAPGKINLALSVGPLADDGYHPLATVFLAVGLYEYVAAEPADTLQLEFDPASAVPVADLVTDDSNLVIRAAKLLAEATGCTAGARLRVKKNVPIAGGMGGGSADAAATLVACNELWGTNLTRTDLESLAAQLGSDVPFAVSGGAAIGTGRGEQLARTLVGGELHWVLRFNDRGISTPAAYRALDEHRAQFAEHLGPAPTPEVDPTLLQALRAGDVGALAPQLVNDLQAPALRMRPELVAALAAGERAGALAGIVSGSGPTLAFLARDGQDAAAIAERLRGDGHRVAQVSSPAEGATRCC
ncbi:4-(cytidine 5'-diphospho)-2-C-methyl-D-erythritol kinase [Gulosibacter sp. GYB002]|uniref:4-(cytidine 5'-diphospho)-2-C-methyl-D-erythritol kinase n=1 Tax=Gulosibacter sp. GYB002 TaxID=2994391 RepID=UPI002F96D3F3